MKGRMSKQDAIKLINRIENNRKLFRKLKRIQSDEKLAQAIRRLADEWNYKISARDYFEGMKAKHGKKLSRRELNALEL
jgi:hypothetical protein